MDADVLQMRRDQAADWLGYASNNAAGRTIDDPIAQAITEGRNSMPRYSSCGDVPNWLWYRLGVRLPWINRTENGLWHVGMNLQHVFYPPAPARAALVSDIYYAGDALLVWSKPDGTDAHAIVVVEHDPGARVLCTVEGGQKWGGEVPPKHPDIANFRHVYYERDGALYVGSRAIRRVCTMADVLDQAAAQGELLDAEDPPQLHQDGSVS